MYVCRLDILFCEVSVQVLYSFFVCSKPCFLGICRNLYILGMRLCLFYSNYLLLFHDLSFQFLNCILQWTGILKLNEVLIIVSVLYFMIGTFSSHLRNICISKIMGYYLLLCSGNFISYMYSHNPLGKYLCVCLWCEIGIKVHSPAKELPVDLAPLHEKTYFTIAPQLHFIIN